MRKSILIVLVFVIVLLGAGFALAEFPAYRSWFTSFSNLYTLAQFVGIGTADPQGLLHLKSDGSFSIPQIVLEDSFPDDDREARLYNSAGDLIIEQGDEDSAYDGRLTLLDGGHLFYENDAGSVLQIFPDGEIVLNGIHTKSSRLIDKGHFTIRWSSTEPEGGYFKITVIGKVDPNTNSYNEYIYSWAIASGTIPSTTFKAITSHGATLSVGAVTIPQGAGDWEVQVDVNDLISNPAIINRGVVKVESSHRFDLEIT